MENLIIITMMMLKATINIMIIKSHQLSLMVMIIAQTITLSYILGMLFYSFWFSYILLLIFLGGMVLLFIYMTSLASNEFNMPSKSPMIKTLASVSLFILSYYLNHFFTNTENKIFYMPMVTSNELPYNLSQLYNMQSMNITIMMIINFQITPIMII